MGIVKNRRTFGGLSLAVLAAAALAVLCWPTAAEAKFVFRDGKWVFVPDEEAPPVENPPVAPQPQPPVVEPQPAVPPGPEQAPAPPPAEKPPSEVVQPPPAIPGEVQPPEVAQPPAPAPPAPQPPAEARPPIPPRPRVQPAPLIAAPEESVGRKYRNPEASNAADEAMEILLSLQQAPQAETAPVMAAVQDFRAGKFAKAARDAKELLASHPDSRCGEAAEWLRAEAVFCDRDYYGAFAEYETFLKNYAGSKLGDKALRREFQCAEAIFGGAKRVVLGLLRLSGDEDALAMLEKIYGHRPTGPLAPEAIFRIAEYKMQRGKFEEAEEQLGKFLEEFPNHERARQAELCAAQCAMAASGGPQYDDAALKRAADTLQAYQDKYPQVAAQENVPNALEKIRLAEAEKKLQMARYYQRAQRPKAAAFYAEKVIKDYPDTAPAAEAQKLLDELAGRKK